VLEAIFGIFLLAVGLSEIAGLHSPPPADAAGEEARRTWPRALAVGGFMGTLSGLLGVGGGIIALPMVRALVRFDMRRSIATTALLVLPVVIVGGFVRLAIAGNATSADGQSMTQSAILWLALLLTPGCLIGGAIGAALAHQLPRRVLSLAFGVLCLAFAARMLGWM
jgi:uncharacterized membrane protein YfcA